MKKNRTLFKDIFREISKTRSRFLSIMLIVMLGVGFFAGIKATCPDMKETAQKYFQDTNLMDNHLKSTMGFTESDIATLRAQPDVLDIEAGYTLDAFIKKSDTENIVARAYSYNAESKINVPVLKSGRMPQNDNECLSENSVMAGSEFEIGSQVSLFVEDGDLDSELSIKTFTVVGIVESSMYINFSRGNTSLGNGTIKTFIYLPENAFNYEVYTDVYITYKSARTMAFYNESYDELIKTKTTELKALAASREKTRYDEIHSEAAATIEDAQAELDIGIAEYEANLALFNAEIRNAERVLVDARKKLDQGEIALYENTKLYKNGKIQYDEGMVKINASKAELATARAQIDTSNAQLLGLADVSGAATQAVAQFSEMSIPVDLPLPAEISALIPATSALNSFMESEILFPTILEQYIRADVGSQNKISFGAALSSAIARANASVADGQKELDAARAKLTEGEAQANKAAALAATNKKQLDLANAEIEKAKATLSSGNAEYTRGTHELAEKRADGRQKLDDAAAEIAKGRTELLAARHDLNDLPSPEWYIFGCADNPGYSSYVVDAMRVDNIAAVFPVFFILVAALVCLTTMTRMVDSQRTEIGTLKALGYSRGATVTKYMVYALSASFIGSALGLLIGFKLFPVVIFNAYRIMYIMPSIEAPFRWGSAIICTIAAMACTGLSAFAACSHELSESPSALMRPKAPQNGKRVFFERISFVWNRLSFLQKVTVRNLGRYKKRIFMTIVGVAGCTALMMAGFGLRHSIFSIVDKQYGSIFTYSALGIFDDTISPDEQLEIRAQLARESLITDSMLARQSAIDVSTSGQKYDVFLFVPQSTTDISSFITLQHRTDSAPVAIEEHGVVITEKIANLLKASRGDKITITNPDGKSASLEVRDITENYTMNYVYMSPEQYAQAFGESVAYNAFVLNMSDLSAEDALSQKLLQNNNILAINYSTEGGKQFRDIVQSLNYIVLVLILCAGALAFVVLYNLANINVEERLREIATIKVLGFYDGEVSAYVHRENTISSLMGMAVGLLVGIPFVRFIVQTAEVDAVMFNPTINAASFIFAAALTFAFTLLVNFAMHFRLKKVDMVSSLKSIE